MVDRKFVPLIRRGADLWEWTVHPRPSSTVEEGGRAFTRRGARRAARRRAQHLTRREAAEKRTFEEQP